MTKLLSIKKMDVEKVEFSLDVEGQSIWLTYEGDRVLFQFPRCSHPFKKPMDDYKGNKNYNLTVKIEDQTVIENLEKLEEKYLKFVAENIPLMKKPKMNKKMTMEQLIDSPQNSVKIVRNWQDLNLLRFKVPNKKDTTEFATEFQIRNTDDEESLSRLTHDDLDVFQNAEYTVVARMYGNFIGSFTFTLRAVRMIIHKSESNDNFLEDSEDSENDSDGSV